MSDLIERDRAIEALGNCQSKAMSGFDWIRLKQAIKHVENLPSAQPEPCEDAVSKSVYEQTRWERDVAIKQLEELGYGFGEKVEPCEDAVSRQEVLDALWTNYDDSYTGDEYEDGCSTGIKWAINIVADIPSVTPQQKGEWKYNKDDTAGEPYYCCSVCESYEWNMYDFCPNCGADMREGDEAPFTIPTEIIDSVLGTDD